MIRILLVFLALFGLVGCGEAVPGGSGPRILLLGDSMMSANGGRIGDMIETEYGEEVIDRSVYGARYFYALPISGNFGLSLTKQFRPGPWDTVVLNGGGNDLLFGCGCAQCDQMLDRLITKDGRTGAIADFVTTLRKTGARVVYVGYLRNPGTATLIKSCGPAGNELDRRIDRLARRDRGVTFLTMADLVPKGDWSYHQIDRIHPSPKGSDGIARRIIAQLRKNGEKREDRRFRPPPA